MHDIGGIIWLIVVLIGVISSVRSNARRAAAQRAASQSPRRIPVAAAVGAPVHSQAFIVPQPVPVPPVITAPAPVAAPVISVAVPVAAQARSGPQPSLNRQGEAEGQSGTKPPIGTTAIRGIFEGPATLIRAIVAAEVLGPPKSMQEQTIWSPRHSEPSI